MKKSEEVLRQWVLDEIVFNGRKYSRQGFEKFWESFVQSYNDPSLRHEVIESRGELYRSGFDSDSIDKAVGRFFQSKKMMRFSSSAEVIKAWRRHVAEMIQKAPKARRRTL